LQAQRIIPSGRSEEADPTISRTVTPGLNLNAHPSNIAPQHMFDSVTLDHASFSSPSLSQFPYRAPSPSASSMNGSSHLEPPLSYDALQANCTALKTRVSELEVINDLFRGRVGELEATETKALAEQAGAISREIEFKRRIEELEAELADSQEEPKRKKMRLSDIVDDDSQASTPLSMDPDDTRTMVHM
jgi:GATA-binding protein